MFPSTCLTILLSRCEDTNCTRRYLVEQPVQVLQRVEKKKKEKKKSYALSPGPSFVLARRARVFSTRTPFLTRPNSLVVLTSKMAG